MKADLEDLSEIFSEPFDESDISKSKKSKIARQSFKSEKNLKKEGTYGKETTFKSEETVKCSLENDLRDLPDIFNKSFTENEERQVNKPSIPQATTSKSRTYQKSTIPQQYSFKKSTYSTLNITYSKPSTSRTSRTLSTPSTIPQPQPSSECNQNQYDKLLSEDELGSNDDVKHGLIQYILKKNKYVDIFREKDDLKSVLADALEEEGMKEEITNIDDKTNIIDKIKIEDKTITEDKTVIVDKIITQKEITDIEEEIKETGPQFNKRKFPFYKVSDLLKYETLIKLSYNNNDLQTFGRLEVIVGVKPKFFLYPFEEDFTNTTLKCIEVRFYMPKNLIIPNKNCYAKLYGHIDLFSTSDKQRLDTIEGRGMEDFYVRMYVHIWHVMPDDREKVTLLYRSK